MGETVHNENEKYEFYIRDFKPGVTSDLLTRECSASIFFPNNQRSFKVSKNHSHSFYSVIWDKGKVPPELSGTYTGIAELGKDIAAYFEKLDFDSVARKEIELES